MDWYIPEYFSLDNDDTSSTSINYLGATTYKQARSEANYETALLNRYGYFGKHPHYLIGGQSLEVLP